MWQKFVRIANASLNNNGNASASVLVRAAGGEYSESEVYLFSDKKLAIVVALIEARERGYYSEDEWRGHLQAARTGPDGKTWGA